MATKPNLAAQAQIAALPSDAPLTPAQAALHLRVSAAQLERMRRDRIGPSHAQVVVSGANQVQYVKG